MCLKHAIGWTVLAVFIAMALCDAIYWFGWAALVFIGLLAAGYVVLVVRMMRPVL
jgi:hypothetical protein